MEKEDKKKTKKEADFFVQATLVVKDEEIDSVACKIYLPDHINEKPWMEFRPSKEQYYRIIRSHEGSLKADIIGFDKRKEVSIEAPVVYFQEMRTQYWGLHLSESTFVGDPQHLTIVRYVREADPLSKTSLILWISPNGMLSPPMSQTTSYTGSVEFERVYQLDFTIRNGLKLTFDKHFRSKSLADNQLLQWSFLVACADIGTPANNAGTLREHLLPDVDDFLLIASLGSRTRTACLGWEAFDGQSMATYYRGQFSFPTGKSEPSFDDGLVSLKDFRGFLECCYPVFLSYPNKDALRRAIRSVVPGRRRTSGESFLSMFAGLETLVLDFRRRENLEFALPPEKWIQLKSRLKQCVKESDDPRLDKEDRSLLYGKLPELNRVPLRIAFERFCSEFNIDLSDLWPVFTSGRTVSLSDIRNRIIHGDPVPLELHHALWVAEENLRFVLERMLLCVLGWPVQKSEVDVDFLRTNLTALKMMPDEQARISDKLWG